MRLTFYVFAIAVITALGSCSDPTLVGAGLLEDDRADVGFSDTLSIAASSITNDSIRTYGPFLSNQLSAYLFGNFNDPLFGRSSASIYAQVFPQNSDPEFDDNTVVDSIVLVLPYDVNGFYGKTEGETFGMEIFQLAEVLGENNEYFSDDEVATEPMPLASAQVAVSTDSLGFIDYEGTDTVAVKFPHYRIHLDESLADYLIGLDAAVYESDSLFLDAFKGLFLQPGTENEGMLSFGLLSPDAGIYLYYHDDAEEKPRRFLYDFDIQPTVRFTNYRHDYQGALAGEFLDGSKPGDSLLFVQGMSGLDIRLEIPNITDLQGLVVNKAELEFYAAEVEGDDEAFTLAPQLILTTLNSEGDLATIEDIEIIRAQGRNLAELFGGTPLENASGPAVYRMNVSAHLQDVIDGNRSNVLFITPLQKASMAGRGVLYGVGHPQYSMKLKITFTKI